jgi:hypothetical protein
MKLLKSSKKRKALNTNTTFTTLMLKQIYVKSINGGDVLIKKMFDEAVKYLDNIGFVKTPLVSMTERDMHFRSAMFSQAGEKVLIEYKKDLFEEVIKLVFTPLEIKFVHDILLMRFNQIAAEEKDSIFIYNE